MACAAQVVTPGSERVIRGEGMPISKAPGQKGNLRLQMDVQARARVLSACGQAGLWSQHELHYNDQVSKRTAQSGAHSSGGESCRVRRQCTCGSAGS